MTGTGRGGKSLRDLEQNPTAPGVDTTPGFAGRAQVPGFEGEPSPSPKKGSLERLPGFIGVAQAHCQFEGEPSPQDEKERDDEEGEDETGTGSAGTVHQASLLT